MVDIFINITRYFFVLSSFYFFYSSFKLYKALYTDDIQNRNFYFNSGRITILLSHFIGFIILVLTRDNIFDLVILYVEQVMFFMIIWLIISKFYYDTNLLLWNIVLYLLQLSFVILTRLEFGYGVRHFKMALLGIVIALIIPKIFYKAYFLEKLEWIYLILCFVLLLIVNDTKYGSKNWMSIGSFSFQPSELVKIFYVLFIASFFRKGCNRNKIIISGLATAGMLIILVLQRDLGTALIFSILYITLLYIETYQPLLFIGGLAAGSIAAFVGYKLFAHVRVRVEAWANPWLDIDNKGYQITQSLFAIGAGKWLGSGLSKGLPNKIPVVITDFIFSAIAEEFGNIFSIFLIAILVMFFLTSIRMAANVQKHFFFLLSAGISIIIAFQQILIIGGVTKLIPLTGVTLPFISYGGTSLISSCIMIGLLQGIYLNGNIKNEDKEDDKDEEYKEY